MKNVIIGLATFLGVYTFLNLITKSLAVTMEVAFKQLLVALGTVLVFYFVSKIRKKRSNS